MKLLYFKTLKKLLVLILLSLVFTSCSYARGYGKEGFTYNLLFFIPTIVVIVLYYVYEELERKKLVRKEFKAFDWRRFKTFIFSTAVIILGFLIVNLQPKATFNSGLEKFEHGIRTRDGYVAVQGFQQSLDNNESDEAYVQSIYNFMRFEDYSPINPQAYFVRLNHLDEKQSSSGHMRLAALWLLYDYNHNFEKYNKRADDSQIGKSFFQGMFRFKNEEYYDAVAHFENELYKPNGFKSGSIYQLSMLYYITDDIEGMKTLLREHDPYYEHVNLNYVETFNYEHSSLGDYYYASIKKYARNINVSGLVGGVLILICWFYFLFKVNPFYDYHLAPSIGTVLTSSLITLPCVILYNFYDNTLGIHWESPVLKAFLEIGPIEELVKLIAFLIFLHLSGDKNEPHAYLHYACLSALGFSFVENFAVYFTSDQIDAVQGRGLIATVGHLIDSSLLAYCMIIGRFVQKKNTILWAVGGYFLACFAHGLYDAILMASMPPLFTIILFIPTFLFMVQLWSNMINNSLNISTCFDWKCLKDYTDFKVWLGVGLTLIIMGEYALMSFNYGKEVANDIFLGNITMALFLELYLLYSLGNYDFFNGYFPKLAVPSDVRKLLVPRMVNTNNYVGHKIRLHVKKNSKKVNQSIFPTSAEIVARRAIKKDPHWYIAKLNSDIPHPKYNDRYVMIKLYNSDADIETYKRVDAQTYMIKTGNSLQNTRLSAKILGPRFSTYLERDNLF